MSYYHLCIQWIFNLRGGGAPPSSPLAPPPPGSATESVQFALKWWLSFASPVLCVPFAQTRLDLEAHHALTCKRGSDVIAWHNHLRATLWTFQKNLILFNTKLEAGSGLGHGKENEAILVNNWGINYTDQSCGFWSLCIVSATTWHFWCGTQHLQSNACLMETLEFPIWTWMKLWPWP